MLQGDAIREITLAGPGAGGTETASAIVADIVGVLGTTGPQSDPVWRDLPRLPPGESRSPFYFRLFVEDRPGTLAHVAEILARHAISVARLVQHQDGSGATLHVVTHEAAAGALADCARRARRARRGPPPLAADPGGLRPRRRGARLGVTGARATWLSLGEGGTPLVHAPRLSEALGLDLHLKCEHLNPTGSFKDRGMAVAVERAAARRRSHRRLRVDREHRRVGGDLRRARRSARGRVDAGGCDGRREARAGARGGRAGA